MSYVDKRLLQASLDNSRLVTVDGQAVVATYLSYELVKNEKYNSITYLFKFRVDDGTTKTIRTKQRKFLAAFARIPVGSKVQITGFNLASTQDRDYDVEVLSKPKMAAQATETQEEVPVVEVPVEESADDDILFT